MEKKKVLTVRDVANELRARGFPFTERSVRVEINAKRMRAYKMLGVFYVSEDDLELYIESRATIPGSVGEELAEIGA